MAKKDADIRVRMTQAERDKIEMASEKLNMSISEFVRTQMVFVANNMLLLAQGKFDPENFQNLEKLNNLSSAYLLYREQLKNFMTENE